MLLKIEIYKTTNGWTYFNSENNQSIAGVYNCANSMFRYVSLVAQDTQVSEEEAHRELQQALRNAAKALKIDVEFVRIW